MQENKKRVLIIHTGGTIGMKKTDKGYSPVAGYLSEELKTIPDLNRGDFPAWDLYEMSPLLDSSNVSVDEWNAIGKVIFDNYDAYSGFVILHGTDTMAYTASALSFMLEGLDKPVMQQLRANESYTGGSVHSNDLTKAVVWPEGLIRSWYNMIKEAYALVDYKKTADPERYEQLWINITAESLFPRWVLCTTYANSTSFSSESLKAERRAFMEDFNKLGNTTHKEHHTISDVFTTWDM